MCLNCPARSLRKKRDPNIQNVREVYEKNKPNKTVLLEIPCPQVPVMEKFSLALRARTSVFTFRGYHHFQKDLQRN